MSRNLYSTPKNAIIRKIHEHVYISWKHTYSLTLWVNVLYLDTV